MHSYFFFFLFQYIDEFKHSQLLSRRLGHHCAKRINMLLCENIPEVSRCQSPIMNNSTKLVLCLNTYFLCPCIFQNKCLIFLQFFVTFFSVPVPSSQSNFNPISASVMEYLTCCLHRSTLLFLSSILQVKNKLSLFTYLINFA